MATPADRSGGAKRPATGRMKLFGADKKVLIEIAAIRPHDDGLMIEGKIMGTMPMKAFLPAAELRAARGLLNLKVIRKGIGMFLSRAPKSGA